MRTVRKALLTVSLIAVSAVSVAAEGFVIAVDGEVVAGDLKPGDLSWPEGASPESSGDWFGLGMVDLTFSRHDGRTRDRGRAAFHVEGETGGGFKVIAGADTGETRVRDMISGLSGRDPLSVLERFDPAFAYPSFGDDSRIEDMTPTSGRVFVDVSKGADSLRWGDFRAPTGTPGIVRNDRAYYGLMVRRDRPETASRGDTYGHVFVARPDTMPQRDAFRATDGSVMFLRRSDIVPGSETVSVEVRDPDTGRVISRTYLSEGADYDIVYGTGVVTLSSPLASTGGGGVRWVVVQYEWEPIGADIDGASYGGRVATAISDTSEAGVSVVSDEVGDERQTLVGADISGSFGAGGRYRGEVAKSSGPGYDEGRSSSGGLLWDDARPGMGGRGEAYAMEAEGAFSDFGLPGSGDLSVRAKRESAGFTSLDGSNDGAVRDYGVSVSSGRYGASYESYNEDGPDGERKDVVSVTREVSFGGWSGAASVSSLDMDDPDRPDLSGRRTDIGIEMSEGDVPVSRRVFARASVARSGGMESASRVGIGVRVTSPGGSVADAEISGGARGAGGGLSFSRPVKGGEFYAGYRLDPDDTSRTDEPGERDKGRFVVGGKRDIGNGRTIVAENSYDLIGSERTLVSRYGIDLASSEKTKHEFRAGYGTVRGDDEDTRRAFLSYGLSWTPSEAEALSVKIEGRRDDDTSGKTDTVLLSWKYRRDLSENARIVSSMDLVRSSGEAPVSEGDYADVSVGYSWRPVSNDDLNMLVKYRYLDDEYGTSEDRDSDGRQKQRSHVFSADAIWDIGNGWSPGAKLGYRRSVSGDSWGEMSRNDAWLMVASLRKDVGKGWRVLAEARRFEAVQADYSETSGVIGVWRDVGENFSVGVGYNGGSFSDDLTDMVRDDRGPFINLTAKF